MKKRMYELRWTLGVAFLVLLLCDPAGAFNAALDSILLWANTVAPALLPFIIVLPLLTCAEAQRMYNRAFGWIMRKVFRLPGRAASAVVVGLLSGSPAGALACARVADGMELGAFKRMALMTAGMSPVYIISGVGVALLHSKEMGVVIACGQLASQLIIGFVLRFMFKDQQEPVEVQLSAEYERPMRTAIMSVLQIAGYMVLFGVIAQFGENLLGDKVGSALLMVLDLPNGAAYAAQLNIEMHQKLVLIGALVGFSGVCVGAQNMNSLRSLGLKWREYIAAKAFGAVLCAGFCALGSYLVPTKTVGAFAVESVSMLNMSSLSMVIVAIPVIYGLCVQIKWKKSVS